MFLILTEVIWTCHAVIIYFLKSCHAVIIYLLKSCHAVIIYLLKSCHAVIIYLLKSCHAIIIYLLSDIVQRAIEYRIVRGVRDILVQICPKAANFAQGSPMSYWILMGAKTGASRGRLIGKIQNGCHPSEMSSLKTNWARLMNTIFVPALLIAVTNSMLD